MERNTNMQKMHSHEKVQEFKTLISKLDSRGEIDQGNVEELVKLVADEGVKEYFVEFKEYRKLFKYPQKIHEELKRFQSRYEQQCDLANLAAALVTFGNDCETYKSVRVVSNLSTMSERSTPSVRFLNSACTADMSPISDLQVSQLSPKVTRAAARLAKSACCS